jgi:hypothetical protein
VRRTVPGRCVSVNGPTSSRYGLESSLTTQRRIVLEVSFAFRGLLSPPASEGTSFTEITGAQGPTGGRGDSPSPGTSGCPLEGLLHSGAEAGLVLHPSGEGR